MARTPDLTDKTRVQEIFFDMDGVLTNEIQGYSNDIYRARTPKKEMISLINYLYADPRYRITIYTARHKEDKIITEEWLKKYGVHHHKLILGKPHYDLLIDDKASGLDSFISLMLKCKRL